MALKLSAGNDVKRGDLFFVNPFEIIVKEECRGRKFAPTSEQIVELAMSIFDNGQRQAIECRRVGADCKLQSTAGFTRTAAIRLIREGFKGTDGVERHDPEYKVQVKIVDCDDKTALINNIVENAHRNQTSDIDDAHNQNSLRERYGYDDTQIAHLYQYKNTNKVGRLRMLLQLTEQEQRLVHDGLLGTQGAIDLLALTPEQRAKVLSELAGEDGKVNGSQLVDVVRDHILADNDDNDGSGDGETSSEPKSKFKARNMRNIRTFFEDAKSNESLDPAIRRLASDVLKWVAGRTTDKTMHNALQRLLEASATEVDDSASEAA